MFGMSRYYSVGGQNIDSVLSCYKEETMKELKNKLIDAIKSIDFAKLNLYELKTVSDIAETVDKLDKKDYSEVLADTMKTYAGTGFGSPMAPKTIAELGR